MFKERPPGEGHAILKHKLVGVGASNQSSATLMTDEKQKGYTADCYKFLEVRDYIGAPLPDLTKTRSRQGVIAE